MASQFRAWNAVKVKDDAVAGKDKPHTRAGQAGTVVKVADEAVDVKFDIDGRVETLNESLLTLIATGP